MLAQKVCQQINAAVFGLDPENGIFVIQVDGGRLYLGQMCMEQLHQEIFLVLGLDRTFKNQHLPSFHNDNLNILFKILWSAQLQGGITNLKSLYAPIVYIIPKQQIFIQKYLSNRSANGDL